MAQEQTLEIQFEEYKSIEVKQELFPQKWEDFFKPHKTMEVKTENGKIYAPLKDQWLVEKPEERVRQQYICRLVDSYGYELKQMDQELKVTNSQRGQGAARADIVVWKSAKDKNSNKSAFIVVECKAESVTIHEEDYYQGYNYAAWAGADFFVTTNLKETRIFRVVKGEIPKKLEEIVDIPQAKDASSEKRIKELLLQTKAFTRDEFSKLLFKCHNIIRNNDKLSPEAAFDEISKILFIKIRYERNNQDGQIFSYDRFIELKQNYNNYLIGTGQPITTSCYQNLFNQTKQAFANDNLFEENDCIKIRENSFEQIVKELQIYNLSTTSDDVKGIAFEQFLGRTFRGELGQFFTPRTLVDFMVGVLDPKEGEYICDPCCGSGGFLINAFEYVRAKIEDDLEKRKQAIKDELYTDDYDNLPQEKKDAIDAEVMTKFTELNKHLDINNSQGRLRSLSFDCIYGTDANPRMARTAKMNMIMHGDGHGGVHHHDGLLNVNGIWENRFDVILTNPPFGAHVEKSLLISEADKFTDAAKINSYIQRYGEEYLTAQSQVNDHIGEPLISLYETGKISGLTEVLFIERCLNLLKPGGRMGIVLPEGVLNTSQLQNVRDYVETRAKILLIVSIPQDVFIASGATVKPSLLFFRKFTESEAVEYQQICDQANAEIQAKYAEELAALDATINKKAEKGMSKEDKAELKAAQRQAKADKKALLEKITVEVKALVKERWNYQIPIAQVEKAGISSTGAPCENELLPLQTEYTQYRKENNLF